MKNIKKYIAAFAIALMTGFGVVSVVTAINAQTKDSQKKEDVQKEQKESKDEKNESEENEADETEDGEEADDNENEADEQAEQAALAREAKITRKQAEAIALRKAQGNILEGELEREEGRLIYSFDIQKTDKSMFEVEVDANTGEVLKAQPDDDSEDEGSETDTK